jgi:SAM-dependent methyltransferase
MSRLYEDDAWLYDLAFSWDATEEIEWLLGRLGDVDSVLEIGCGSGRFFPHLVRHGIRPFGVDLSPEMVDRARRRLGEPATDDVITADMTDFDLGRRVGGAFCAVNTIGYLTTADAVDSHLDCVARHLEPGGRYLVQLDLYGPDDIPDVGSGQVWEEDAGGVAVRFTWEMRELDVPRARAVYRSRIEVLDGIRAGDLLEEDHPMRAWTWQTWSEAVERSPFEQTAAYDGDTEGWPRLQAPDLADGAHLIWHELVAPGGT